MEVKLNHNGWQRCTNFNWNYNNYNNNYNNYNNNYNNSTDNYNTTNNYNYNNNNIFFIINSFDINLSTKLESSLPTQPR